MAMTSIIIATCNGITLTKRCLESIRRCTPEQHEIICVDNGSTDGTVDLLQSAADIELIENSVNRGMPAAINQGLRVAAADFIVLLNNDVVVTPGWLGRMLAILSQDHKIGLVGPCSNNVSGIQCVPTSYRDLSHLDAFAEANSGRTRNACRSQISASSKSSSSLSNAPRSLSACALEALRVMAWRRCLCAGASCR